MVTAARLAGGIMAPGILAIRIAGHKPGDDLRRGVRNGVRYEAKVQSTAGESKSEVAWLRPRQQDVFRQRVYDFGLAQRSAAPHVAHTA